MNRSETVKVFGIILSVVVAVSSLIVTIALPEVRCFLVSWGLPLQEDCSKSPFQPLKAALPEMVNIPAGKFWMGDFQHTGESNEYPVHIISVNSFAMSRHEVTFDEYDYFVEQTGRKKPDDNGWGRGNRPVIHVSWEDATVYAEWLSERTGEQYGLPTEAEWEYAARAMTDTDYWWGKEIGSNRANCEKCGSQWDNKSTAPVCSFAANPFGLCDTAGNVWEWTCSVYDKEYKGEELRCASKADKRRRVFRGGAWHNEAKRLRVSFRLSGMYYSWYISLGRGYIRHYVKFQKEKI